MKQQCIYGRENIGCRNSEVLREVEMNNLENVPEHVAELWGFYCFGFE